MFAAARFDFAAPRDDAAALAAEAPIDEAGRTALVGVHRMKFRDTAVTSPLESKFSLKDSVVHDSDKIGTAYLESQLSFGVRLNDLKRHIQAKCMQSVFHLITVEIHQVQDPANANAMIDAPRIVEGKYLLNDMLDVTVDEVQESIQLWRRFSTQTVDLENLGWSHELLLNCCDDDLRKNIAAKLLNIPAQRQGGPVTLLLIYQQIMKHTKKSARAIITQLTKFRISSVPGENIDTVNSYITGCMQRLDPMSGLGAAQQGIRQTYLPLDFNDIVLDIMLTSTVTRFTEYFRILQVMRSPQLDSAESIMAAASTEYHELFVSPEGWLPTKKSGSSFQAQSQNPLLPKSTTTTAKTGATGPEYDRRGNLIDRTPPSTGTSTTRTRGDGTEEFWCGTCNRWGNHLEGADHDSFQSKLKAFREKMKKLRKDNNRTPSATPPPVDANAHAAAAPTVPPAPPNKGTVPSSALGIINRMSQLRDF